VTEPDDTLLLRQIRQGDHSAFQTLYRRHRSGLYSFALLHCGSPAVAADVVQDVFMGLLGEGFGFDPLRGMLANYLYGVARRMVHGHARKNERWVQPGDDENGDGEHGAAANEASEPLARLLDHEATERLRRALKCLAPHYRDVLILYEMHELSYQQIAEICELDLGTVRSRLSRARARLAAALAPYHAPHMKTI
jgi:RNA polymerase sigma-70 factor (ECF subfamily)